MENGVSHQQLNEALGKQSALIIGKINRTEDSLKETIKANKEDVDDDVKDVSERITYLERRSRTENIFASVLTFLGAISVYIFGGK